MRIPRPRLEDLPASTHGYVQKVVGDDALHALTSQRQSTARFLTTVPESRASFRYAEGKWSLREVVGHVSDSERVFAYRLLRFARHDATPLSGFDENQWMPHARFEKRSLEDVVAELMTVRAATLVLISSLDEEALACRGVANGNSFTVAGLAWIIAGHEAHHMGVLHERYL